MKNSQAEDIAICPITGSLFDNPIYIDCGHTFELDVLKMLVENNNKKCPLCFKEFTSIDKINYAMKAYIHVKEEYINKKKRKTREEMIEHANKRKKNECEKIIDIIMNEIEKKLMYGEKSISISKFMKRYHHEYVISKLSDLDYKITHASSGEIILEF